MAQSVRLEGSLHLGQEAKSLSLSSRAVTANLPSNSPKPRRLPCAAGPTDQPAGVRLKLAAFQ